MAMSSGAAESLGWLGGGLAAVALLLAGAPGTAAAQQPADDDPGRWSAALRIGFSSPKGDLGDMGDDGQLVGLSVDRRVGARWRLGAEATLENLERGGRPRSLGGVRGPDIELWRLLAVAGYELTEPEASPWEVAVHAGIGATRVDASASANHAPHEDFDPSALAGGSLDYRLGDAVSVFARVDGYLLVADAFGDDAPPYLSKEVTLTHTGGVRVRF